MDDEEETSEDDKDGDQRCAGDKEVGGCWVGVVECLWRCRWGFRDYGVVAKVDCYHRYCLISCGVAV